MVVDTCGKAHFACAPAWHACGSRRVRREHHAAGAKAELRTAEFQLQGFGRHTGRNLAASSQIAGDRPSAYGDMKTTSPALRQRQG